MNHFQDEQPPAPPVTSAGPPQGEPEPRLLTRPETSEAPTRRPNRPRRQQHEPENGLRAWAGRLAARRQQAPARHDPSQQDPSRQDPSRRTRQARLAADQSPRRPWFLWLSAAALACVCILAVVLLLLWRHALVASLPQLDGDLHLAGLHAPVTVTRDGQGVPSITAANLDDLLFAQGYLTAGDRLWQMDGLRRHAAGELAEILGPGLIEHDRRQRYLQIRATADRAVAELTPDQLAQLEAYARGVNSFIDTHRGSLPVEFHLLAYKPAPWSPRDSLLVSLAMFQDLSTGFPEKLNREALSAHLPADLLPDLYPIGSWRDHSPAAQNRNITTPHEVEQIPLDPSQSHLLSPSNTQTNPQELAAISTALSGASRCDGCRSGSNNWAVAGLRTASGAPVLSNDMHLSLGIPDIWYEAGLHAYLVTTSGPGARLDAVGFTLPGVPFVIVGRNTHVAWGITNLGADVQDVRVEHLRGAGDNTEFQHPDGTWSLALHHPERIHVRGGRDVSLDVLTTVHPVGTLDMQTPVISPLLPSDPRALSLAWTAYDPAAVTALHLGADTATDGASLVASLASFGGPTLNLLWADDSGHIGYHAIGRIPVRGPALQHPRTPAAPITPQNPSNPLPTDGDDEGSAAPAGPQAELLTGPHLLLSAFRPLRRRRRFSPAPPSSRPARTRNLRRPRLPENTAPAPVEAPVLPTPQALDYTVGSPLSPIPVDALDPAQAWSGYIGYGDLPSVTDPVNGYLVTANSRITPDDYPWAVADNWIDPFRTDRIVHLLSGRHNLTPADMLRLQNDVHSDVDQNIGQRLAYALDHASPQALGPEARRLHQAADLLRNWDGNLTVTSPAAAIVIAVRTILWPSLLMPQIQAHSRARNGQLTPQTVASLSGLYTWGESTTALELLLQNQPARWLPPGFASWNDFLATVTLHALATAHAPADLHRWQYGQLHRVEIAHPIFGDHPVLSRLLGIPGTTGAHPAPGDTTTVKALSSHFGPSERFTADLSSPDATFANLTTGESDNGRSSWYLDQFRPWLEGTTFALPLTSSRTAHTLRLLPQ